MMKRIILISLWLAAANLLAQSPDEKTNIKDDKPVEKVSDPQPALIEFNGVKYNGYVIEFNSPPDIVEEEVKEKFKSQGVKPKKTDGFLVYRNVLLHQIDPAKAMDAFIKIERKSKKESDKTIAYFIAAYPGEIPEDKIKSGGTTAEGVTAAITGGMVLKGLHPGIEHRKWEKSVLDQQAALNKEEKKLEALKKAQIDMEKKIEQLKVNLETNANDQVKQTEVVEKAKNDLNDLITKKPGGDPKN